MSLKSINYLLGALLLSGAAGLTADDHMLSSAVDKGLTFYCSFDEKIDADQAAGNGKAQFVGALKQRFAPGIKNSALRIGNDKAKKATATLNFAAAKNITSAQGTVSCWIKAEDWEPAGKTYNLFVTAWSPKGFFFLYKPGPNLNFYFSENKKVNSAVKNVSTLKKNEWYHIVSTWDAKLLKLYVDGKLVKMTKRTPHPQYDFTELQVGYRTWPVEQGYTLIDELKIFNRPLTESEISQQFARVAGSLKQQAGAIALTVGEKSAQVDGQIEPGEYKSGATGFFDSTSKFGYRQSNYFLSYDAKYLYIGVKSAQVAAPLATHKERDSELWFDDGVEVWLYQNPDTCYQIITNPIGTIFDTKIVRKKSFTNWNLKNYQVASKVKDGYWTTELAIPLKELGAAPQNGQEWHLNIGRTYWADKPSGISCIAPTRGGLYNDLANYVTIKFQKNAPSFVISSLGKLNNGKVNVQIALSEEGTAQLAYVTQERVLVNEKLRTDDGVIEFKQNYTPGGVLELKLNSGNTALFSGSFMGQNPNMVAVQYIYTDIKPQILHVALKNESSLSGGSLVLKLIDKKSGKVYAKPVKVTSDKIFWTEHWSIANLPVGDYNFEAQYVAASGRKGAKYVQWYRKSPKVAPWDNNTIGIYPGEVPAPWVPLKQRGSEVTALMQVYGFAQSVLPTKFQANGHNILSRPIELKINGQVLQHGAVKFVEAKPDYVTLETSGVLNGVKVATQIRIEFDGMMWIKMTLNGQLAIRNFTIDIPLKKAYAQQVHSCDGDTHHAAFGATGLIPEKGWHKNLYGKPAFWVGNDDAGIAWYAETLQGWRNHKKDYTAEILPGKTESIVRLNVIDMPYNLRGKRTLEFGLHGTPVKHPNNETRYSRFNEEWGWSPATKYFNYLASGPEFFNAKYYNHHREIYKKKKSTRFFLYLASNGGSPYCPEWGYWGKIWTSRAIGDNIIEYTIEDVERRNQWVWTYSCLNSKSFREFYLWQLNNVLHDPEWNVQDFYYDLVGPRMCNNTEHGCGWKDDDGNLWPSQNLKGARDFHKRAYFLQKKLRPGRLNGFHVTGQPVVPAVHSFADFVLDGESFYAGDLVEKGTYFGIFTPEMFRTYYDGKKWGYNSMICEQLKRVCYFHHPEQEKLWDLPNPPFKIRQAITHLVGYLLVHDCAVWSPTLLVRQTLGHVWERARQEMGGWDAQVDFVPYWRNGGKFSCQSGNPKRIMVSAFTRGAHAMLVVMNDTNQLQKVQLHVEAAKLLGRAKNIAVVDLAGKKLPVKANSWSDTVAPQAFNVYFVK